MLVTDFSLFPELYTERLLLRKIIESDGTAILRLRSDERVMQFIDRQRSRQLSDAAAYIQKLSDDLQRNLGITWGIALKEKPGELIGTIGYWRFIKEHHRAEIGYMLDPNHWQKGLMKEAILKVLDQGFNSIQLHSIEAHINPANSSSAAILLATGFIKEAYFRESYYYDGVFKDSEIYGRLKDKPTVVPGRQPMDKISIKPISVDEIPALVKLVNSAYRGSSSKRGWTTEADLLDGIRVDEKAIETLINQPGALILAARNGEGELVGTVSLEKQANELYLGMLSVSPAIQATGIGKQLMAASEKYASEQGCTAVMMTVIEIRKELIAWYIRHGYQPTGEIKPFPNDPSFGIPRQHLQFIVLKKQLAGK